MTSLRCLGPAALAACFLAAGPHQGTAEERTPRVHALVGARIVTAPGKVLNRGTIVVRDGVIVAVGKVQPPADARIWDLQGRTVYPGLIEAYLDPTSGKPKERDGGRRGSASRQEETPSEPKSESAGARHPNPKVVADQRIAESLNLSADDLEAIRGIGFAAAHVVPNKGVFRGQSALIELRPGGPREQILADDVAQHVAFEYSSFDETGARSRGYPSSLMGAVALVRQTFSDAVWARQAQAAYAQAPAGKERPQSNLALDALATTLPGKQQQPVWLVTQDVLGTLRAASLGRELGLRTVLVGNGEEYQQLGEMRALGFPLVLPVAFPAPPDVDDEDAALDVELDELRHWKLAPANAARLHEAGVEFALTSNGLEKRDQFRSRVAQAIAAGLPEPVAVAAVTTVPARLLGVGKRLGSIEPGKIADLTVTDGDLFGDKTHVLEVWVDGDRYEVRDPKRDSVENLVGRWKVVAERPGRPEQSWILELQGSEWTLRGTLADSSGALPVRQLRWQQGELLVRIGQEPKAETLRLVPAGKKELRGSWQHADGTETPVEAERSEPAMGGER
jgi:hypothetical protein